MCFARVLPSAPISRALAMAVTVSMSAAPFLLIHRLTAVSMHTTSVRWKRREPLRKQVWLPRAPSKLFDIKEKVYLPRDEQQQMDHMRFNYESDLLSIRMYCRTHYYLPTREAGGLTPEQVQAEEEQHQRRLEENEIENKRIAAEREKRLADQRLKRHQELVQQEIDHKQQQEIKRAEAEQLIDREVERSASFITKDNLLSAIQDALQNPISYDFAIDKYGNVVTDGKIHVQAFTPSAVPESSINATTMIDATGFKFKATKLY